MCRFQLLFSLIFSCFFSTFGGLLTLPNGDLDKAGVENHILQLEETVSELTSQLKDQAQIQAAVLSNILSRFATTSDDMTKLNADVHHLETKYNFSILDLSTVKHQLSTNSKELSAVKSELQSLKANYNAISTELVTAKSDLRATSEDLQQAKQEIAVLQQKNGATGNELTSAISGNTGTLQKLQENLTSVVFETENQKVEFNTTMETFQNEVDQLKSAARVQIRIQQGMTVVETDVLSIKENITNIQQSLNNLTAKLSSSASSQGVIAFSSVIDKTIRIQSTQVVKYNHILFNVGQGYNNNTGIFTCPIGGIYIFHINFPSGGYRNNYHLVHNNDTILTFLTSGFQQIHVNKGDNISVMSLSYLIMRGNSTIGFASFSGYLLAHISI